MEKWAVGQEEFIEKWIIAGVRKKRGIIIKYFINNNVEVRWFSKQDAISLATAGKLHATLVHLKNGTTYLRPEHQSNPFE